MEPLYSGHLGTNYSVLIKGMASFLSGEVIIFLNVKQGVLFQEVGSHCTFVLTDKNSHSTLSQNNIYYNFYLFV